MIYLLRRLSAIADMMNHSSVSISNDVFVIVYIVALTADEIFALSNSEIIKQSQVSLTADYDRIVIPNICTGHNF